MGMIEKAYNFAKKKHANQLDDCGELYFFSHVEDVYSIICVASDDKDLKCAALLHDTLEDTDTTYKELCDEFSKEIADLVNEVTHDGEKDEHGFYFPRLKSKKAVILKFADRLSNLSRMDPWPEKRQQHYLKKSKFWRSSENRK